MRQHGLWGPRRTALHANGRKREMPWGSSHLRCSQGMAFMDSNLCAASPLFRPVSRFSALPGLYRKREKGMCDVLLRSLQRVAQMARPLVHKPPTTKILRRARVGAERRGQEDGSNPILTPSQATYTWSNPAYCQSKPPNRQTNPSLCQDQDPYNSHFARGKASNRQSKAPFRESKASRRQSSTAHHQRHASDALILAHATRLHDPPDIKTNAVCLTLENKTTMIPHCAVHLQGTASGRPPLWRAAYTREEEKGQASSGRAAYVTVLCPLGGATVGAQWQLVAFARHHPLELFRMWHKISARPTVACAPPGPCPAPPNGARWPFTGAGTVCSGPGVRQRPAIARVLPSPKAN
jgi:hypothetical protein